MINWPLAKLYIRRLELTVDEAREDLARLCADCDELKAAALRTAAERDQARLAAAEAVALLRESIDRILFVEQGAMDLRGRISAHLAACDGKGVGR